MKHTRKTHMKLLFICAMFIVAMSLGGCGKKMTVSIVDGNVTIQAEVTVGKSVQSVLDENNIVLGEKDKVYPDAISDIPEDMTEIVIARYAKATINYEGQDYEVEVVGGTVADALKEAKIELGENAFLDCEETDIVTDGMSIQVKSKKNVEVVAGDKKQSVETDADTVKELLEELNLTVGEDDILSAKPDAAVTNGMTVKLDYVTYKNETVTEDIPYETETKYSDSMDNGTSKVTQAGVNGSKEVTYKVTIVNDKEDSREVVEEKVIQEAVNEIVTYGTKTVAAAPAPGESSGKTVVSKQEVLDCDGSGHGYYDITYSDGSHEYIEF